MIQDREVQALWEAVEDIRKRIDSLGDPGSGHKGPCQYVASMTSNRKTFHLRGCKFTRGFMQVTDGFWEFRTQEDALAAGLVPCKSCSA